MNLDSQYWDNRYLHHETGWDMGVVSPPLKSYIDQIHNKDLSIMIPGGGNSYEAAYLASQAFGDVTVIDIAPSLVEKLQEQFKHTRIKVICGDFFEHTGSYDLVLEQTFFCAIDPAKRPEYAAHMYSLLKPGGHLAGVLFDRTFEQSGPPFGGSQEEYEKLFSTLFDIKTLQPCYNSHPARKGCELFINLMPKIKHLCDNSY
ncbi:methyltransferase domain-containing protein [Chitinophaga silvatica]|uniref:Methyltransferase domain-containing protein n=1 Tax=Chitinophaga silvatica TaxID=2282649 RepID=A0A3E1YDN1_9BACT|nr:methyltransferase domain-containing protein [Chitinophaga silvatica]RFS24621.1 methyltransferase domain-containing protein [Chitinophaga silvatica]